MGYGDVEKALHVGHRRRLWLGCAATSLATVLLSSIATAVDALRVLTSPPARVDRKYLVSAVCVGSRWRRSAMTPASQKSLSPWAMCWMGRLDLTLPVVQPL